VGYVEPPEFRAGVLVFFDGVVWRLAALNIADGQVPASLPTLTDLTGERLADEFRAGWVRALDGSAPASATERWISAVEGRPLTDEDLTAAWARFFIGGGAVFRVAAWPSGGTYTMRYGWGWPLTDNDPIWRSDKPADNLPIDESPQWRIAIEDEDTWRQAPRWDLTAAWMRDRSTADSRVAAWWAADEDGAPRTPIMTGTDAEASVRTWWTGETSPTGSAIIERYGLPEPDGNGFWSAWLHWDPKHSPRPDGLADVLGLRRAGNGVDVVWWPVEPQGGIGRPVRAVKTDGGPLDIDRVERLVTATLVLERRPPDLDWTEAGTR
jgi:hypothetical protein